MFPNSLINDRHALRHSADALFGVLTTIGLGLTASMVGLVFVVLLPFIGAVLLVAVVLRATNQAVPGSPPRPTAIAPLCGSGFAC